MISTAARPRRIFAAAFLFLVSLASAGLLSAQEKPDALVMYRNGNFTGAIEVCQAEIADDPSNLESYVVLSWSLVKVARYEEADSWAARGRELYRYDPRLIEIQAEAKYYRGLNADALRLFQDYITYAPNGSRLAGAYAFMGELYVRLGRYRHADISFSAAIQLESSNVEWWVRLGYAREKAKEYRYALEAYNKAIALDATNQDAGRGRERVLAFLN